MSLALKKTHAKVTNENVRIILPSSLKDGSMLCSSTLLLRCSLFLFRSNKGKKPHAWIAPHKINFQFAPCQKPLMMNTKNTFLMVKRIPFFDPPNGIYK